jgi:aminopeptidase N
MSGMRCARLVFALLALATVTTSGAARAESQFEFDVASGRLPRTVAPRAYRIDITPDLTKLTFSGREAIDVDVRAPTAAIVMNQAGLTLRSAVLESGASADITQDQWRQIATLTFAHPVAPGRHTLTVVYDGRIRNAPHGIYYRDYRTADGVRRRVLATQFEAADARRMFPGWDDPGFKATFQLSATVPADFAAISNMPVVSTTPVVPDAKHVVFANSPAMSSYLVALVAGELSAVNGQAAGAETSAWVPPGQENVVHYALDVARQVLPFYESYFGVPYPLPKLDLVAVPGNYPTPAAMENLGAITFIGDSLFFDPETSSATRRERTFLMVAHEMAHQWSGDLVTMGWWDDLWLNEGIATWMEAKAADHFNPGWDMRTRQHASRERAMSQDALATTHPVRQEIRDEFEAFLAFDDISYDKASQVLGMIEDWIGPDVFRDGVRSYIKAHAYSSATSADLWSALGEASHRDVAKVAKGFIEQPGLPVVRVTRTCNDGQAHVTLTQVRFAIRDPGAAAETWNIPVSFGEPGRPVDHILLTSPAVTVPIASCMTPIKVNLGEAGYYRTQYDEASLKALAGVLSNLEAADRVNLLGDQFALFVARRGSLGDYLDLSSQLRGEQSTAVWEDTLSHFRKLDGVLQGAPEQKDFDAYAIGLIEPEFARLGWDAKPGESFVDGVLRPKLIAALGQFGDADIIAEATRRFLAFVATPNTLPAGLRSAVLDIVGHAADQATYNTLRMLETKAGSRSSKVRYLNAMAAAADPALIRQNVNFAASDDIPDERVLAFLVSASRTSGKPDLLYSLVASRNGELDTRAAKDDFQPTALMAAATGSLNEDTAKALLAAPSSRSSGRAHTQALGFAEEVAANVELRRRTMREFKAWMTNRHHGPSASDRAN